MKTILFLSLLLPLALGCTPSGQEDTATVSNIQVDIPADKAIHLPDLFESVTYTPLATADSFLIGDVDRMKVVDGRLYLLSAKRLLSFDTASGETGVSIDRLGMEEEEYQSLYDMYIDTPLKQIELLDMAGKKIRRYDFGGRYRGSVPLPFQAISFTKVAEQEYMLYTNNLMSDQSNYQLFHYSAVQQKVLHQYLKVDQELAKYYFVIEGNNFRAGEKQTFFSCPSHMAYEVRKDWTLSPLYQITFGEHQPPSDFYKQPYSDIAEFAQRADEREYVYFVNDWVENDRLVLFSFRLLNRPYWSFYDKRTKKVVTGNRFADQIADVACEYNIAYNNSPFAVTEDTFYFLVQPTQVIETFNLIRLQMGEEAYAAFIAQRADLKRMLQSAEFNEQSNPVLVSCAIK